MTVAEQAEADVVSLLFQIDEVGHIPDPVVVARQLGIKVLDSPLEPDVACALYKEAGEDPIILLNQRDSVGRRRFNCAHCIGHFVQWDHADEYVHIEHRRAIGAPAKELGEAYADSFAAALLMRPREILRLKREFGLNVLVSYYLGATPEAVWLRFRDLELIAG